MTETEFPHDAPTLFAKGLAAPGWRPHQRLEGIRYFIEEHNRRVNEKNGPDEDRIVGVLMDSATSMAGFETTDSGGATSLLFYLNRMCRALDVFWAIIGHTQKQPEIDSSRPRANSVARLRGSAMWSTAPRMVVEVRLACDTRAKSGFQESSLVKRVKPDVAPRDILVVDVAKANVPVPNPEPRYLVRQEGAILVDVTDEVAKADRGRKSSQDGTAANDPRTTTRKSEAELEEGRLPQARPRWRLDLLLSAPVPCYSRGIDHRAKGISKAQ